ncbi:MAG: hypothetical protein PUD65_00010 [Spirochaetales bacterium]|nr:hypothetical protein [Spirochaetales bacterium]
MREEEEYKREVLVITIERDNKRLLDIYRRGEEKDTLSERAFNNVYDRVEYALSSSSLMDDLDEVPTLEERIRFFFDDYYFDNVPDSSRSDIRYYITAFKRFFLILLREGEIDEKILSNMYSLLSEYL